MRKVPPGLRTDVPVAVLVVASWLLVAADLAHLLTGVLATAAVVGHLVTRRPGALRRLRTPRGATAGLVALAALATLVSRLLRWFGVPPEQAGHAASGYALLGFMVTHVLTVRRSARVRLRRRSSSSP